MTSSMVNTLRIRFNSRTVSFFKKAFAPVCKKEGSGWRRERRGRVVCLFFSQNKRETKMSNLRNYLIAFLFIPFLKTPTSF